jgi:hypothetical protein
VKHLEEIAEDWLCARRTLSIISVLARKWKSELPEEALTVLARTDAKYGFFSTADVPSPKSDTSVPTPPSAASPHTHAPQPPNKVKSQNPLVESLYSYPLPPNQSTSNIDGKTPGAPSQRNFQHAVNSSSSSSATGSMTISMEPQIIPASYSGNYSTSISNSRPDHPTANRMAPSETASSNTHLLPKVNPTNLFNSVDMLAQSQNTWLRDQANMAVGFDNWMSAGTDPDMNHNSHLNNELGNDGCLVSSQSADFFAAEPTGQGTGYTTINGWQPGYG